MVPTNSESVNTEKRIRILKEILSVTRTLLARLGLAQVGKESIVTVKCEPQIGKVYHRKIPLQVVGGATEWEEAWVRSIQAVTRNNGLAVQYRRDDRDLPATHTLPLSQFRERFREGRAPLSSQDGTSSSSEQGSRSVFARRSRQLDYLRSKRR
jgi:hypothetical protein